MSEALIERLRHWLFCNEFTHQHKEDLREAADRIEALEREVKELRVGIAKLDDERTDEAAARIAAEVTR